MPEYFFIERTREPHFVPLPKPAKFLDVTVRLFFLRIDLTDDEQARRMARR